jgi:hypothetical protein
MVQGFAPHGAVGWRALALAAIVGASLAPLARPLAVAAANRFQLRVSAGYHGYARSDGDTGHLIAQLRNAAGDVTAVASVLAPVLSAVQVPLQLTAPGRYEGDFPAAQVGSSWSRSRPAARVVSSTPRPRGW